MIINGKVCARFDATENNPYCPFSPGNMNGIPTLKHEQDSCKTPQEYKEMLIKSFNYARRKFGDYFTGKGNTLAKLFMERTGIDVNESITQPPTTSLNNVLPIYLEKAMPIKSVDIPKKVLLDILGA